MLARVDVSLNDASSNRSNDKLDGTGCRRDDCHCHERNYLQQSQRHNVVGVRGISENVECDKSLTEENPQ